MMVRHKVWFVVFAFGLFCRFPSCEGSRLAAMAIDLGNQNMKIAIVKPSVPMEVILNRESQRKTPCEVAIDGDERYFSDPALNFRLRKPAKTYGYLVDLLGKKVDHEIVHLYKERFPYYNIIEDPDRGTVLFQNDNRTFSVEELIGMQISEARKIASEFAGQTVEDAIITVPFYFNQAERRAMVSAAKIGQVKLLQLINDNTAAGVNYGMFRRKEFNETSTKLMIFDVGAIHTAATIYEYALVKDAHDPREKNPQMTVLGFGYDRTLGGLEITMRLRGRLVEEFLKAHPKLTDIKKDAKAMNKLLKEAERVKKVLSANSQCTAQVESLYSDINFRAVISRSDLENLLGDVAERINATVSDALDMAELNIDDLDNVVLMGGGTRMPNIQEFLQAIVNRDVENFSDDQIKRPKRELGKYLNTDEAIVMGSVYQAAHRSKGFKVKKFYIKDVNNYPIAVDFEKDPLSAETTPADDNSAEKQASQPKTPMDHPHIRRVLFPWKNLYPQGKKMTFSKHSHDFELVVNYGDLAHLNAKQIEQFGSFNVSRIFVSNVTENVKKNSGMEDAVYRGARVHFRMDESGILQVESAELHFDKTVPIEAKNDSFSTLSKIGQTISNFFGGSSDGDQLKNGTEDAGQNKTDSLPSSINGTISNGTDTKDVQKKIVKNFILVNVEISFMDIVPLSQQRTNESLDRIKAFEKFEKNKRDRARCQHNLDSFVSDFKIKLDDDHSLIKVSTQDDRDIIRRKLDEVTEWSDDYGSEASEEVLKSKLKELKTLTSDLTYKAKEYKERPAGIESVEKVLNYSSVFLTGMKNFTGTETGIFTEVEMSTLEKLANDTQKWLDDSLAAQSKLPDTEKPLLTVASLAEKMYALEREIGYLLSKAKYAKPKTPKQPKPSANETADEKTQKTDEKSQETKDKMSEDVEIPETEAEGAEPEKPAPEENEETVETAENGDKHTEL